MANIKVVIGANFGDEGKGLMTDYFCHQATSQGENCIVVMSNGGAQRGHTVVDPLGARHVFKHFGSGTLVKADTYCIDDFILNPMEFRQEYDALLQIGYLPKVYVHPNCRWSTPYDMIINQIVEETRENKKHGSCGMGIWETVYRYQKKPCVFNLFEFATLSFDSQVNYLKSITAEHISATAVATALSLGEVLVRKDLAAVSGTGKPKVGYAVKDLIKDIAACLGSDKTTPAVLVGAGNQILRNCIERQIVGHKQAPVFSDLKKLICPFALCGL